MIWMLSADKEFQASMSPPLQKLFRRLMIFDDVQAMGSALKRELPEGILFDLRFDSSSPRLLERIYLELPSIITAAVTRSKLPAAVEFCDGVFSESDSQEEIAAFFREQQSGRELLKQYGLAGRSAEMIAVARMIQQVAPTDITVLITGPSGAGKEMVARALHGGSGRPPEKFYGINIGSLAPGVIESELFGHEKGSFTGAQGRRLGYFELASGGTLFLDEIGDLPPDLQVKLLKVIEDKHFFRVGGDRLVSTDARLIFATNKNLAAEVEAGRFRNDLFYRLNVVNIIIPPLSARPRDIPPLVYEIIEKSKYSMGETKGIESNALRLFLKYNWPGNVRELKNVIESLLVLSERGIITLEAFEKYIREKALHDRNLPVPTGRTPEAAEHQLIIQALISIKEEIGFLRQFVVENLKPDIGFSGRLPEQKESLNLSENEKSLIIQTLRQVNGNRKKAAAILGIGERTLYRKINKYGLK